MKARTIIHSLTIAIFLFLLLLTPLQVHAQDVSEKKLISDFGRGEAPFFRNGSAAKTQDASTLARFVSEKFLQNYIRAYLVTKDTRWLDKLIMGADTMLDQTKRIGTMKVWLTAVGSVGRAWIKPHSSNSGSCKMLPGYQVVTAPGEARLLKGETYVLEFTSSSRFEVSNFSKKVIIKRGALFEEDRIFVAVPGIRFFFQGKPSPGDKFIVTTAAPERMDQIFEDAMIVLPMAQFANIVFKTPSLKKNNKYIQSAIKYIRFIEEHVVNKWEKNWHSTDHNKGTYMFGKNPSLKFPMEFLPHHQSLAFGRLFLALMDIPGLERQAMYRERAEMMARYFKLWLTTRGDAYIWNLIDKKSPSKGEAPWPEETATSYHVIGFVVEAYQHGVVFTKKDLQLFANTLLTLTWNGNRSKPAFGKILLSNSPSPESKPLVEWINLGIVSDELWQVLTALFKAEMCDSDGSTRIWYIAPHVAYASYLRKQYKQKK